LREGYLRFGKPRKRRAGRNPSGRTDWHARHGHLSTRRTPPVSRATQEIRGEHDSALREKMLPVEVPVPAKRGGYFQAILRDVSERKGAEEALQQAHQNYVTLVNSLDGILWEADAQTFSFCLLTPQPDR